MKQLIKLWIVVALAMLPLAILASYVPSNYHYIIGTLNGALSVVVGRAYIHHREGG